MLSYFSYYKNNTVIHSKGVRKQSSTILQRDLFSQYGEYDVFEHLQSIY